MYRKIVCETESIVKRVLILSWCRGIHLAHARQKLRFELVDTLTLDNAKLK